MTTGGRWVLFSTAAAFVSDKYALYATGKTLTLVDIVDDTLRVLERRDTTVAGKSTSIAPTRPCVP
ncbi:MAG TPA: hypothetical protein VIV60_21235 [Polyangiaceae bacterium]